MLCIMSEELLVEKETDYSVSVFLDENELCVSSLIKSKLGDTCTGNPGRLLGKSAFYLEVKASQYIVHTFESGYKLIFVNDSPPPPFMKRNNLSALNKAEFVYDEFIRLEK